MNKLISSILLITVVTVSFGQQLPRYSQYKNNLLLLNPAVTGFQKYMEAGLLYRSQWVGFDGAPKSQLLTVHSSMDKKNFGLGGYLYNDQAGPVKNSGLNFSYAYHLSLNEDVSFSLGLSGSVGLFGMEGNVVILGNDNDNLINSKLGSRTAVADAAFGTLLYSKLYYAGLSVLHLPEAGYKVFDGASQMMQERHYYLVGGYVFKIDKKFSLSPNVYVNYMVNNPTQTDINLMLTYDDVVGFGTSYRSNDAVILLFEFTVIEYLRISYSYDILVSKLSKHNSGSHELLLGYRYYYNPLYKKTKARYNIKKAKKKEDESD